MRWMQYIWLVFILNYIPKHISSLKLMGIAQNKNIAYTATHIAGSRELEKNQSL